MFRRYKRRMINKVIGIIITILIGYISTNKDKILESVSVSTHDTKEVITEGFIFQELDYLGRTQKVEGVVSVNTLPKENEKRESIGMIKPSGWHTYRFDDLIEDKYLYNRCHLVAWSLSKENANLKNLITCTRQANLEMIPYEKEVKDYVISTGNLVDYKVEPIYENEDLIAKYIHIQASSEDNVINIDVYIENKQKGIEINYKTGEAKRENE